MTQFIIDIDRPDINQPAKMHKIVSSIIKDAEILQTLGFYKIVCDDNLMSSIKIYGSLDQKQNWPHGIFENSKYFIFFVSTQGGKRYYTEGDKITVEFLNGCYKFKSKFRKYTGTQEQVLNKIASWVDKIIQEKF